MIPTGEALKGKICLLFFSSEWCGACKAFLPTLATLYEEAQEKDMPFEVVYVSSDHNEAQKDEYAKKHGEWLSVPYGDVETRSLAKKKYGCFAGAEASGFSGVKRRAGIPSIVIMGPNGEEHVHMDCDPATEINRKGSAILDDWSKFAWPAGPQERVLAAAIEESRRLVKEIRGLAPAEIGSQCKRLAVLTSERCAGEIPAESECIRFLSSYPPDSEVRFLTNLAAREFCATIQTPSLSVDGTFTSVEALFQGLKFNLTNEFAKGGALEGEAASTLLETIKAGIAEKIADKVAEGASEGITALHACRLLLNKPPGTVDDERLASLSKRRSGPFTQVDSGLVLLACQLLMYSANADARQLLLEVTGDKPLEEYSTGEFGPEFWSRFRPTNGLPPLGENANGQNLMQVRAILRGSGGRARAVFLGQMLFEKLDAVLAGEAALSDPAAFFYSNSEGITYAELLAREAPAEEGGSL